LAAGTVEAIETHISRVFLVGNRVYKLKRAVAYPYLDFSTVTKRREACETEVALNRRTAPNLYLGVRAVVRRADGRLSWAGDGEIVDWVVEMRRFPQASRLDAVAQRDGLTPALLYAIAAQIADFHAKAESQSAFGGANAMADIVRENEECLLQGGKIFSGQQIDELCRRSHDWMRRLGSLLDKRRREGKVKRGHGDLHLRNICVIEGKPILYDCLEFSERLASVDVLYDLAFLLMDLEHQEQAHGANLVFNRYLDLTREDDGLAAVPLFISLRAAIRAHVTALACSGSCGGAAVADAGRYLEEACTALCPVSPHLIAIGGLSGTGKSTLAAGLAPGLGLRPGARVLRSDVIRKRLFGLDPEARLPAGGYGPEVTARVYDALRDRARAALQAGYSAIIDAVALRSQERASFAAVASEAGVSFTGLWLEANPEILMTRVGGRHHDASDATGVVVAQQLQADPGQLNWHRVDAGKGLQDTLASARRALAL
jgi:aminoglycoside phosphotransferase family enzyme/predicted kinase